MSEKLFNHIHNTNLIYNICWEDPRLDRQAMKLSEDSRVLMITSAGDNALDYLLDNPAEIHCVDMNPAQNALLEIKLAAIKSLSYEDYFTLIGEGGHPEIKNIFEDYLKANMSQFSAQYWQTKLHKLIKPGYIQRLGTCGFYAKLIRSYLKFTGLYDRISEIFNETDSQVALTRFQQEITNHPANKLLLGAMNLTKLSYLLGVPPSQLELLERTHEQSLGKFVENVMLGLAAYPQRDNYFYQLYLTGNYSEQALPEYLKKENFETLKSLVNRIHVETGNLAQYSKQRPAYFTHMVLLDHMDWLANQPEKLHGHFNEITSALCESGRALWRSAATYDGFLELLTPVLNDKFQLNRELAENLHKNCRVMSYGSFFIADKAVTQ